jgi:hypothetical protein
LALKPGVTEMITALATKDSAMEA